MSDAELQQCRDLLGVPPDATAAAMNRAYLQKSYALIRSGAGEADRERLKAAHARLLAHLGAREQEAQARRRMEGRERAEEDAREKLLAEAEREAARREPKLGPCDPRSFDSRVVNLVAPPLMAGLAILAVKSPLGFLLGGFQVWVHEFGHATVAWLTGKRALPLPIGWTPVGPERSEFVYFGVLFLLGALFVAGVKERKVVPMLAAIVLALAQFVMTWRWPETIGYKWSVFGGVGGEFYLSAAMMGLFYFRLPEKFRWGGCRYMFLFIGAATFSSSFQRWRMIRRGEEGIPYGSMIHGEEDAGGDMNILFDDYGWSQRDIIHTFNDLATVCLVVLVVLYAIFALRLDRVVTRWLESRAGE